MCICDRIWLHLLEPIFRRWPTYPPDWQRRRLVVFERANGRCQVCGFTTGRIGLTENGWQVIGAHVHHAKPIARGGRHGWDNLRLLCVRCHWRAHPGNRWLTEAVRVARERANRGRIPDLLAELRRPQVYAARTAAYAARSVRGREASRVVHSARTSHE